MAKYKSLIFPDEKKVKASQIVDATENAENVLQNSIFAAKRAIRDYRKQYNNALSAVNFSPEAVITAKRMLAQTEADLIDLEALKEELF